MGISYIWLLALVLNFMKKLGKIRAKIREIEITDTTTDSFNTRNLVEY